MECCQARHIYHFEAEMVQAYLRDLGVTWSGHWIGGHVYLNFYFTPMLVSCVSFDWSR